MRWTISFVSHLICFYIADVTGESNTSCMNRDPPIWPHRLVLVQHLVPHSNSTVSASTTVTFYDWERGANLIQITPDNPNEQVSWDLELDSKKSYYFTPATRECREKSFPVGILRPDWLNGSEPIGESTGWNGRTVCGWTKGPEFINYYEDKHTREPNSWFFF
mmetsp:Transcript_4514/g.6591  ORF Transcript_4514/g.6591 Transcript_4514/m.6591 type:complete len:163 (+) Transcript_4514:18-506(+)